MRFDNHEPIQPILSRRHQTKIIFWVVGLGMLVLAFNMASGPGFWDSLANKNTAAKSKVGSDAFLIDGGRDRVGRPLADGEFFGSNASALDRRLAIDDSYNEADVSSVVAKSRVGSPFQPEVLDTIKDNTLGVRSSERMAYYYMLAAAKRQQIPPETIQKNASFSVLMTNPDFYRGAPIQIKGKLKRLFPFKAADSHEEAARFGVSNLYDAWIFTRESGSFPYHVVCSSPGDLPLNESFESPIEVSVTGYFFKREGYSTQSGGLSTTPLILAQGVNQIAIIETIASEDGQVQHYLMWFAFMVAAALFFTMWNFAVSDWNFRYSRACQSIAPPANADLHGVDSIDINDVLRDLAESPEFAELP